MWDSAQFLTFRQGNQPFPSLRRTFFYRLCCYWHCHYGVYPSCTIPLWYSAQSRSLSCATQPFFSLGRNPFLEVMLLLAMTLWHLVIRYHPSLGLSTVSYPPIWNPTFPLLGEMLFFR